MEIVNWNNLIWALYIFVFSSLYLLVYRNIYLSFVSRDLVVNFLLIISTDLFIILTYIFILLQPYLKLAYCEPEEISKIVPLCCCRNVCSYCTFSHSLFNGLLLIKFPMKQNLENIWRLVSFYYSKEFYGWCMPSAVQS